VKIERFFYGMVNGKISLLKTSGVNKLVSDKNFQFLRNLRVDDSDKYLWLPTEQVVALPHIIRVEDDDGRTWVQNETFLIPIHNYIQFTDPYNLLSKFFHSPLNELPEKLEPLEVKR